MNLLLITNFNHIASKKLVKFLKLKRINFDYIDSSKKKVIKIPKKYDYLISFLNSVYINKNVRKKIKINSFNFHPGPPEYPGFGCYNFALLDKTNFYGTTVHIIDDKFDNGEIVNVNKFKVLYKELSLEKLIKITHKKILEQAKDFIKDILNKQLKTKSNFRWKKKAYTKKQFEIARKIKLNDSKRNILRKIKAFSYKDYESIYVNFKRFKFELKKK